MGRDNSIVFTRMVVAIKPSKRRLIIVVACTVTVTAMATARATVRCSLLTLLSQLHYSFLVR